MRIMLALVLPLAIAGTSTAQGQPKPPNKPPSPSQPPDAGIPEMLRAGYALRRAGEMKHAIASFERALELMGRSEQKRAVARETVDMCRTLAALAPDKAERDKLLAKAMWIYRRNSDALGEIEVLLEMDKIDEALTTSRLLQQPKGEAMALAKRGRNDEALALYQKHGFHQERGLLLRDQKRFAEAAAAFALSGDAWEQAQALEAAGKQKEALDALEAARVALIAQIRDVTNEDLKKAKAFFAGGAAGGVERERAKTVLARCAARASEDYERLARIYVKMKREKGDRLAENAINAVTLQIDTLLDKVSQGGRTIEDVYGKKLVEKEKLEKRREDLRKLMAEGAAIRPSPPPPPPKDPPKSPPKDPKKGN